MVITALRYVKQDLFEVYVDHENIGILQDKDLAEERIMPGCSIDEDQYAQLLLRISISAAKRAAGAAAARRMYTQLEMEQMLKRKGHSEEAAAYAAAWLLSIGMIDDAQYAEKYAKDAAGLKKHGKMRIIAELKAKGIEEQVAQCVAMAQEEKLQSSLMALVRKAAPKCKNDAAQMIKLRRRLYQRGYPAEEITAAIKEVLCEECGEMD